jgi:hypothetical protein
VAAAGAVGAPAARAPAAVGRPRRPWRRSPHQPVRPTRVSPGHQTRRHLARRVAAQNNAAQNAVLSFKPRTHQPSQAMDAGSSTSVSSEELAAESRKCKARLAKVRAPGVPFPSPASSCLSQRLRPRCGQVEAEVTQLHAQKSQVWLDLDLFRPGQHAPATQALRSGRLPGDGPQELPRKLRNTCGALFKELQVRRFWSPAYRPVARRIEHCARLRPVRHAATALLLGHLRRGSFWT